jgi:hypothetical protein
MSAAARQVLQRGTESIFALQVSVTEEEEAEDRDSNLYLRSLFAL